MKISFLIPTYFRHDRLERCVRLIRQKTSPITEYEILLYISEDDNKSIEFAESQNIRYIKSTLSGYKNLHIYYNELANIATGDYLFILNDDAFIITDEWDMIFKTFEKRNPIILIEDNMSFLLVKMDYYKIVGHLALHPYVDTWLINVGKMGNMMDAIPMIKIEHDNFISLNKPTPVENIGEKEIEIINADIKRYKEIKNEK